MTETVPPIPSATGVLLLYLCRKLAVDGSINLPQLEHVVGRLVKDPVDLPPSVRRAPGTVPPEAARRDPFKRLLVRPIEHLLGGEAPIFPRAYLPNYLAAMEGCLGEGWRMHSKRCQQVLKLLLAVNKQALSWDRFYGDSRILLITAEALEPVAERLTTGHGREAFFDTLRREVDGKRPSGFAADYVIQVLVEAAHSARHSARHRPSKEAQDW